MEFPLYVLAAAQKTQSPRKIPAKFMKSPRECFMQRYRAEVMSSVAHATPHSVVLHSAPRGRCVGGKWIFLQRPVSSRRWPLAAVILKLRMQQGSASHAPITWEVRQTAVDALPEHRT
jgi:hypothetical protein